MRTAKWLASSVLVVLLVRALVLVQARPTAHQEGEQRVLSREKRFSMNEYLVLALSVFNVFVFLYNNIETFFPAALTKASPEPTPAPVSTYNIQSAPLQPQQQQPQQQQLPSWLQTTTEAGPVVAGDLYSDTATLGQERQGMIDQIAEMLIR